MQSTENTPETRRHVDVEILADAVLGEAFVRKSNLLESAGNQLHELARDLHRTELALAAERDRADRAEARIAGAPHGRDCLSFYEKAKSPGEPHPCTCWKSEATA